MLELDHVFCIVSDPDQAVRTLEEDGWVLDAGRAHRGQGTRNRRLAWREQLFARRRTRSARAAQSGRERPELPAAVGDRGSRPTPARRA